MQTISPLANKTVIKKLWQAMLYSLAGINCASRQEFAFQMELLVSIPCIITIILVPASPLERSVLIASGMLVMVSELINSAIEAVVDLASPDHHPLAKRAKDMASGAVFLSILTWAIIWSLVLTGVYTR